MGKHLIRTCAIRFLVFGLIFLLVRDVALEMSPQEKLQYKEAAREMFYHSYNAYMSHAYPADELMPLSCRGRYRDTEPSRGDIDDALGNFSLTLVDSLDTLVVLGDVDNFEIAVRKVINDVSFDHDIVVSVFETNIRMLGGLLSGHILACYLQDKLGHMTWYKGELLSMAKDLGYRLLPAFNTTTGVPYPRINLRYGIKSPKLGASRETCTACAGTMILEFAALSRLTGEPIFEEKTHRAMDYLWQLRHRASDLMGTVLNIHNGDWVRRDSGVGAGIDSYYEYLLKAYILLGDDTYLERFNKHYSAVMKYISQGPMLVDVHMHRPHTNARNFMDALLAFWPGLQVLKGDIKPAIETHEMLYQVMQRHNFLPEAFTTDFQVHWGQHPLRPEFLESTYFLFKATGDPYYLEVGKNVLISLQKYARVPCGFAAVKDVRTGSHEDRMDSFVLAETFKYLYLLFAENEDFIIDIDDFLFTTEAHLFPLTLARLSNTTVVVRPGRMREGGDDILEEEEDLDYDHTCPNTEYLFPGKSDFAQSIRQPLKNLVEGVCPKQKSIQRHLHASEFQAGNEDHLKLLRKMGISITTLQDGRIQLQHTTAHAETSDDAEEGLLFMQEMIELSKSQEQLLLQQQRAVHFETSLPDGSTRLTFLSAGPAQFGVELTAANQITAQVAIANPPRACKELENGDSLQGKVGIVERGDCMFVDKARLLQRAGAVAGIVMDNVPGTSSATSPLFAMSGDGSNDITIPMVFLFNQDAAVLIKALKNNPELRITITDATEEQLASSNEKSESSVPLPPMPPRNAEDTLLQTNEITYIRLGENGQLQTETLTHVTNQDGSAMLVKRVEPVESVTKEDSSTKSTDEAEDAPGESEVIPTVHSSDKEVKKSDVESIITLLNREKEYVQTLQRLIQTALGGKKELDGETKVFLDQLSELMQPREQGDVPLLQPPPSMSTDANLECSREVDVQPSPAVDKLDKLSAVDDKQDAMRDSIVVTSETNTLHSPPSVFLENDGKGKSSTLKPIDEL